MKTHTISINQGLGLGATKVAFNVHLMRAFVDCYKAVAPEGGSAVPIDGVGASKSCPLHSVIVASTGSMRFDAEQAPLAGPQPCRPVEKLSRYKHLTGGCAGFSNRMSALASGPLMDAARCSLAVGLLAPRPRRWTPALASEGRVLPLSWLALQLWRAVAASTVVGALLTAALLPRSWGRSLLGLLNSDRVLLTTTELRRTESSGATVSVSLRQTTPGP